MSQEDKKLLLQDLSARLPYGVMVQCITESVRMTNASPLTETLNTVLYRYVEEDNIELKPYLRPMSSMTEVEKLDYTSIDNRAYCCPQDFAHVPATDRIDWLNKYHFDYRGLIKKGLAVEAPKGMYVY